jgi:adenylylsulfate kinase
MDDKGLTVWFTGLSGAGKTTLADAVHLELRALNIRSVVLDADDLRKNVNKDLGFSKHDRDENVRRIGIFANGLSNKGLVVLVAAIAPYRAVRAEVRSSLVRFIEVYVNAPLQVCEHRDAKGLYKTARAGLLPHFTGLDDPYEPPLHPEVECNTDKETLLESTGKVVAAVLKRVDVAMSERVYEELGGEHAAEA